MNEIETLFSLSRHTHHQLKLIHTYTHTKGYLIKVRSRHGLNRNVVKRYSSLRKLHGMLKERFPTRDMPPFPPKRWFSSSSTSFVKKRRFDLEHYLQQLASNVGIMRLQEVIEFWETSDVDSEQHQVVIFGEIPEDDDDDDEDSNVGKKKHHSRNGSLSSQSSSI